MAYPNILAHRGNGTLQYLSAAELADLTELVLEKIAADGTVGCLTGVNSSDVASVGDFTDTYRQSVTNSGDLTIISNVTTLYQNMNSGDVDTSTRPHPVVWDTDTNSIMTIGNGHLHDLCDEILSYITTQDGPMSHKMSTIAPSGGTWVSVLTLLEKQREPHAAEFIDTNIYIWKKTAGTLAHTVDCVCPEDGGLKHMTASEVSLLAEAVKARMIATGIGSYALAQNAPATGTWTSAGTIVDRRLAASNNISYATLGVETSYYGWTSILFTSLTNVAYSGVYYNPVATSRNFLTRYYGPYPVNYSSWTIPGDYNPPSQFLHYTGTVANLVGFYGLYAGFWNEPFTGSYYRQYWGQGRWDTVPYPFNGYPTEYYHGDGVSGNAEDVQTLTLWRRIG